MALALPCHLITTPFDWWAQWRLQYSTVHSLSASNVPLQRISTYSVPLPYVYCCAIPSNHTALLYRCAIHRYITPGSTPFIAASYQCVIHCCIIPVRHLPHHTSALFTASSYLCTIHRCIVPVRHSLLHHTIAISSAAQSVLHNSTKHAVLHQMTPLLLI